MMEQEQGLLSGGDWISLSLPLKKRGIMNVQLPVPMKAIIICSSEDWKRRDRQEAVKKQCEKTFNDFFYRVRGRIKPRPKKERPKTSALTKKIYNMIVLQDE